jgi:hypothetical protein
MERDARFILRPSPQDLGQAALRLERVIAHGAICAEIAGPGGTRRQSIPCFHAVGQKQLRRDTLSGRGLHPRYADRNWDCTARIRVMRDSLLDRAAVSERGGGLPAVWDVDAPPQGMSEACSGLSGPGDARISTGGHAACSRPLYSADIKKAPECRGCQAWCRLPSSIVTRVEPPCGSKEAGPAGPRSARPPAGADQPARELERWTPVSRGAMEICGSTTPSDIK